MGQIFASYNLMPAGTEVDLNKVIAKISDILPAGVKLNETSIKPVAFGLQMVIANFVIDDTDPEVGGKLENGLRSIEGIENVECASSTVL